MGFKSLCQHNNDLVSISNKSGTSSIGTTAFVVTVSDEAYVEFAQAKVYLH